MKLDTATPSGVSLARANRMLLAFSESVPELEAADLARRAGLRDGAAERLLATLCELRLLERSDDGKRYRLALRFFEIGMLAARQRPVFVHAEPVVERLAGETGETAALAVLCDRDVIFLAKAEAAARSPLAVGRRYPARCCAAGKVLLAGVGDGARAIGGRALAAAATARSGDLSRARRTKTTSERAARHATDREELFAGVASIAVPIVGSSGNACGALALSGPAARLTIEPLLGLAPTLYRAAAEISRRLGHRPGAVRLAG